MDFPASHGSFSIEKKDGWKMIHFLLGQKAFFFKVRTLSFREGTLFFHVRVCQVVFFSAVCNILVAAFVISST